MQDKAAAGGCDFVAHPLDYNRALFPHCSHGPALVFARFKQVPLTVLPTRQTRSGSDPSCLQNVDVPELFFACSATRDRRHCPLYMKLSDQAARLHKQPAAPLTPPPPRNAASDERTLAAILASGNCSAEFCSTCITLLTASNAAAHALHDLISIRNVFTPSRSLPNLGVDDASAQYFFSPNALDHLLRILAHSRAGAVVGLGCPSVHEALVSSGTDSV